MKPFLTAEWVNLILVSWKVPPSLLTPHLPKGTELDLFQGDAYLSMIAFEFRNTRVRGMKIPFHVNFPEVNLRCYAKAGDRRGVVFLRELIPLPIVAWIAQSIYSEPYQYMPIRKEVTRSNGEIGVRHVITHHHRQHVINAKGKNEPYLPDRSSLEHFLKEHGRGYGTSRDGTTITYGVAHRFWPVYPVTAFAMDMDFGTLYGPEWEFLSRQSPDNVTLAQGSEVQIFDPTAMTPPTSH